MCRLHTEFHEKIRTYYRLRKANPEMTFYCIAFVYVYFNIPFQCMDINEIP